MKVGIDLGGSHIGIGVVNQKYDIIEKYEKYFTKEEKKNILPIIEKYIINTIKKIEEKYEIKSIGIAVPGMSKDGVIIKTVNLNISNYDITKKLNQEIKIPISIKNDGKCAALAEYNNLIKTDVNIKDSNVIFLNIGTGIGGAVIYEGKLLEGHNYEGFEMGHMIIKKDGIPCKCGKNGCFEKYGSILEYKNKVKERLNINHSINGDNLREIMDSRKDEIEDLRKEYIVNLAIGISNLINIFEPDVIIIGGGFSHFSYMFIDDLKRYLLETNLLFNKRNEIDLRIAELSNDAGIIGAAI